MNISDIREKYPQYQDLSDEQLLKGLHSKFYSDMDYADFAGRIGGNTGGVDSQPSNSAGGDTSLLDKAKAVVEPAMTIGSSMVADPVAGLAGLQSAHIPNPLTVAGGVLARGIPGATDFQQAPESSPLQERVNRINQIQDTLTYRPRSEAGQRGLESVAKAFEPLANALQSTRDFLGEGTLKATGSPAAATAAAIAPEAGLELLGLKLLRSANRTSATRRALADKIESGGTDRNLARFISKGGKAAKDPIAINAIKQGFDEGVIAAIKGANTETRLKMQRMAKIAERRRENAVFAQKHRPSDVAGDALSERILHIRNINKIAGNQLDSVAKSLKGKPVDASPAMDNFLSALDDMGIKMDGLNPVFKGSSIEGLKGPQNIIKNVINRLASGERGMVPDAYELHRMKKFIDENVTYGKSAKGLGGKTEGILKGLRRDLDQILDANFEDYNKVNTTYAETRGAMDAIQDVAGKKMNLAGENTDKALGVLLRRLMGNAQSRVNLIDAVDTVQNVATKYGGVFSDDIDTLMLFADELDTVLKPAARTSFKGEIGSQVERAVGRSKIGMAADVAGKAVEKVRGISDENAIKAIQELLSRN